MPPFTPINPRVRRTSYPYSLLPPNPPAHYPPLYPHSTQRPTTPDRTTAAILTTGLETPPTSPVFSISSTESTPESTTASTSHSDTTDEESTEQPPTLGSLLSKSNQLTIICPSSSFCVHSPILARTAPSYKALLRFPSPKDVSLPPNTAYLLHTVPVRPFTTFLSWCYSNNWDDDDMSAANTVRVGVIAEKSGAVSLVDAVGARLEAMSNVGREVVKTLYEEGKKSGRLQKVVNRALRRQQEVAMKSKFGGAVLEAGKTLQLVLGTKRKADGDEDGLTNWCVKTGGRRNGENDEGISGVPKRMRGNSI